MGRMYLVFTSARSNFLISTVPGTRTLRQRGRSNVSIGPCLKRVDLERACVMNIVESVNYVKQRHTYVGGGGGGCEGADEEINQ